MRFIEPHVEWWPQETIPQHIARVGRICYKSAGKQPKQEMSEEERKAFIEKRDEERCQGFWKSGHRSMFRHGSAYFFVKNENLIHNNLIWSLITASPYIDYVASGHKVWISTNMQFLNENPGALEILSPYAVSEQVFSAKALKYKCTDAIWLLRMTFVVTTQISTSRELNRTSPNAISEQSTRYCNLEKKGGVQIAQPHWYGEGTRWQRFLYKSGCKISSWVYGRLLRAGLRLEDARGVLPLDTYTVVAYTYSLLEWKHILYLRLHNKTGKAHPNARYVARQIGEFITRRMKEYIKDFEI